jgi:ankyrin repeat protein
MWAAGGGHHKVVSYLIGSGANVDEKTEGYGRTALHMASERGHLKVVEELLNAGAKIDEVDTGYSTPLMVVSLAARGGHHDVVSSLITRGADIDKKDWRYLVICGAGVDKEDRRNPTTLHWASARGHLKVVEVLLNAGT